MGDLQQVNGGLVSQRHGFGETEIQATQEVAASSMAEREKAMVQAMYIMAMQRPRDMAKVRLKLLADCRRPGFAEVARYRKPVGRKKNEMTGEWEDQFAEGWSIRFAEAAMRHLGNLMLDERTVSEDEQHIGMRYMVADLESNVVKFSEKRFAKTVERSSLKKGQSALAERTNSKGDKTYIVAATEDDLGNKVGATRSKFHRTVVTFVDGDILDECLAQINATFDQMPPAEQIQRMIQGFAALKVSVTDLDMYMGHSIMKCSKDEVKALKEVFAAIKTGEAAWRDFLEAKAPQGTTEAAAEVGAAKLAAMKNAAAKPQPAPQAEPEYAEDSEVSQEPEMMDPNDTPFDDPKPATQTERPRMGFKLRR